MKRLRQQQQFIKEKKRRKYIMLGLGAGGGLLLLLGILLLRPAANEATTDDLSNQQLVAMGEDVYVTYCAACHGFDLEGQPEWQQPFADGSFKAPPHDETGHTWHHSDAYLIESIKQGGARLDANIGVSNMPAYEGVLTDQQIFAVLAYIKTSWPTEILEAQSTR